MTKYPKTGKYRKFCEVIDKVFPDYRFPLIMIFYLFVSVVFLLSPY